MKAVIMAGGFGTRIQPLTSSLPKPMIPVLNRPMMEHTILALKEAGISEIVILLYFMPEVIRNYFGDGSEFGVKIDYCLPNDDYGTAGAVKKAEALLDERFLVISGDLICDFDLKEIIGFHETHGAFATLALTSVEDPLQFGVVMTTHTGKIMKFLEKPAWGEVFSDTINTGIYVLEPEALKYIPNDKTFDFSKDLFPLLMANNHPLYGYKAKGYWRDVGNPDAYRQTCIEILEGKIKLPCDGDCYDFEHGQLFVEDERPFADVIIIGKVIAGKNVTVGKNVTLTNCILGDNVVIKNDTSIKNSVIWDNVVIGSGNAINFAVICNNVIMGANVTCHNGCIIAENTEVGNYVIFDKDIMVWPNKQIEDHSILSSNLIWGDKWKRSIFEGSKVTARTNVELSADLSAKLGAALGSALPKGSVVLVSRDYNRACRMLKRAFLGGLVSSGVDTVDIRMSSMPVLHGALRADKDVAGVYFKQYPMDPNQTEIQFLDNEGLPLDPNTEKNIERLFYRENFRRVPHDEIGNIIERPQITDLYCKRFLGHFDRKVLNKARQPRIVVDLLNGTTDEVFPYILNSLGIDAVVLNSYQDEHKLARTMSIMEQNVATLSTIVTTLKSDMGVFISPHAERLFVTTDTGEFLTPEKLLLTFIMLLDMTADKHQKVYVPAATPTVLDSMLKKTQVVRGKFIDIKSSFIRGFDLMADLSSGFIFPRHSLSADSMYTAVKGLELLQKLQMKLSEVVAAIPDYFYTYNSINCPTDKKGYLMRKMSEEALGGEASYLDGVKISFADKGWVLMLPDQYSPNIHLFVEANNKKNMESLSKEFQGKIHEWIEDTAV